MIAKIIVILLVLILLFYQLSPSLNANCHIYFDAFRSWFGESPETGFGTMEHTIDCYQGHAKLTPEALKFVPRDSQYYTRYLEFKEAKRLHGTDRQDGIDDVDVDCYWQNGALLCP